MVATKRADYSRVVRLAMRVLFVLALPGLDIGSAPRRRRT